MGLVQTSRLPDVGTTIFTTMSALAAEHGAINLGQGFPDFDCDPALIKAVSHAMNSGHNQYPPMAGVAVLRERVADKIAQLYGYSYDPSTEITITAGATQALLTTILALVHPGDEVIVLEPCYDSYVPNIVLAGGTVVRVALSAGTFKPDLTAIKRAITPKTRALIINSPHNPSGGTWSPDEMQQLAALLHDTRIVLISDEVYEHMVYDGKFHQSIARYPALAERSVLVSSFGKTFHVTGWKVGYVAAPKELMLEFRKVHQFNVFTVNTPMQYGLAEHILNARSYTSLWEYYQKKRDLFRAGLANTPFKLLACEGSYFQCVSYANVPELTQLSELQACQWLTTHIGVAAIPLSAFYSNAIEQQVIRFCFAKRDETLHKSLEKLNSI
jgi:methionine transaminase